MKDEDTRGCGWFLLGVDLTVWIVGAIILHLLKG